MSEAAVVHHYSAERARQGVLRWMLPLAGYPLQLWRHRALVWNFFRRDLLGRFRGSFLGVFWVLLQPIFLFALYYVVFGLLLGPRTKLGAPDPNFAFYLFVGVIAWGAYAEGAARACNVVVENGNLVKKVAFPCEMLPVHVVLTSLLVYIVGALVVLAVGVPLGRVQPSALILAWPLVWVVHFVFTLGIGLFLANLQVFMRDANQLLGIVHQALMFACGAFITIDQIDGALKDFMPHASALITWLPWYHLLQAHREVLGVHPEAPLEFWTHLGVLTLWALAFLAIGYGCFMSRRHKFADLV